MNKNKLLWDGSHLGDITKYLDCLDLANNNIVSIITDKDKRVKITAELIIKNNLKSVIADEIKYIFGIMKIGKHCCTIRNKEYIISKYYKGQEKLSDLIKTIEIEDGVKFKANKLKDSLVYNIKKCFIFKIIMGFCTNTDAKILIIPGKGNDIYSTTIKDDKIDFMKIDTYHGSTLSNVTISKWFKNWRELYDMVREMFDIDNEYENDLASLKMYDKIKDIVDRIDRNEIGWINQILAQIDKFRLKIS